MAFELVTLSEEFEYSTSVINGDNRPVRVETRITMLVHKEFVDPSTGATVITDERTPYATASAAVERLPDPAPAPEEVPPTPEHGAATEAAQEQAEDAAEDEADRG